MIDEATKEYITPPIPANILYAYEFDKDYVLELLQEDLR